MRLSILPPDPMRGRKHPHKSPPAETHAAQRNGGGRKNTATPAVRTARLVQFVTVPAASMPDARATRFQRRK